MKFIGTNFFTENQEENPVMFLIYKFHLINKVEKVKLNQIKYKFISIWCFKVDF